MRRRLRCNLRRFTPLPHRASGLKRASVAVIAGPAPASAAAFGGGAPEPVVAVTQRAAGLRGHPGQWAFPGGRLEPGETALAAAIRETHEELGLPLTAAACLGRLDDYETRSGYAISAFVFWAPLGGLVPNPAEVAAVQYFALGSLARPGSPELVCGPDPARPIIRMHVGPAHAPVHIHAPTGAILHQFHEVAVRGRSTRVGHFDQPDWAR